MPSVRAALGHDPPPIPRGSTGQLTLGRGPGLRPEADFVRALRQAMKITSTRRPRDPDISALGGGRNDPAAGYAHVPRSIAGGGGGIRRGSRSAGARPSAASPRRSTAASNGSAHRFRPDHGPPATSPGCPRLRGSVTGTGEPVHDVRRPDGHATDTTHAPKHRKPSRFTVLLQQPASHGSLSSPLIS